MARLRPTKLGWLVRGGGVALASALIIALSGSSAWADTASDSRATFTTGNVTTCAAVGFSSDTMVGSSSNANASDANVAGTVATNSGSIDTGVGQELDVSITGTNIVIDAVMVKGGNAYNLYTNPAYLPPTLGSPQHYISPYADDSAAVPTISHWFVCYHVGPGTSTPEVPLAIALPLLGGGILGATVFVQRRRSVAS